MTEPNVSGEYAAVPCGCPPPQCDDDDEYLTCPHWCVEDVPTNALRDGDVYAIHGDLPLEVNWLVAVGDADPVTGAHYHRPFWSDAAVRRGPSTPFDPTQPCRVLRFGMVGRQTLEADHFGSSSHPHKETP